MNSRFSTLGSESSISETLAIVAAGMRRLGITGGTFQPVTGIPRPKADLMPHRRITPEMVARMVQLRETGKSQNEIAREIGVNQASVSKWLIRAGGRTKRWRNDLAEHAA
jgi:DNA invertase Pin-like site-specific DNA recombinase